MRIGINGRFYGARITGVQRVARELCSRLYEQTDTAVFLPRGVQPDLPAQVRTVRGFLAGQPWEQFELPIRARTERCDVMLQLSGPAPLFSRGHVMMVYDVLPLTHPHWFAARFAAWYKVALTRASRRAALVLTDSEWAKQEMMRCLDLSDDRIRVITQGLEPFNRPATAEAVARVRSKYSLPDDYLLATGGGDPRKNIGFMNSVLAEWPEEDARKPDLVVVGQNAAQVHRGPSSDATHPNIKYVGHVTDDELRALYTGARVFCFPSLAEGFGRPPLEALGCGTPSVVSTYDTAFEVLGDAAIILPLNVDLWVKTLVRLCADAGERTRLVTQGSRITPRYRWETATEQVLDACATVAQGGAAALPRAAVI